MNPDEIRLLDGEFYAGDPYPTYAWMREHSPVHWDAKHEIWGISRFADVVAVEKNPERYSSLSGSRPKSDGDTSMINTDDPHHNRRRRLVSPRFTPRAVRKHEATVRRHVTELVDAVAVKGECEVVEELAAPLPAMVINEWLGFPPEMWKKCKWWSEVTMAAGGQYTPDGEMAFAAVEEAGQAVAEFAQEVLLLAAKRREEPRDDLVSVWANAEPEGQKLRDEEIVSEALLVLDGGAETTRAVIATTVMNLIEHPQERRKLAEDPSPAKMKVAVEEFIRWVTPILNMRRTATETHELHGKTIREGDELLLMYSSANRDPAQFEQPDRYDVSRSRNQHLAFGWGTHFCLGASLARMELRIMFEELMKRIPEMRMAPGVQPRMVPSVFTRGPDAVHIEFTRSA
ncbi:MAG: cytochrome P450 [Deltaproteobacteria bacterium]|jgi:cytochrome P450 family 142 subfamily A polypeptide 1|nr:cytochrome P450 [Deltaproteobacteria bacterium]